MKATDTRSMKKADTKSLMRSKKIYGKKSSFEAVCRLR